MQKFTDNKADDWLVEITVFHVDRCKVDVGVNINDALVSTAADGDEQNLITRMDDDASLLVSILYSLCQDQVKERGLSPEDFARRMAGDVLNAAFAAFVEALQSFFRKPNQKAALRAQIKVMEQGQRRLLERWKEAEPEVDAMASQAIERQLDTTLANLRVRFGAAMSTDLSTAPPAS